MPNISLTDEQKQTLLELLPQAPQLVVHRARLILAYAAGKPTLQAASEAGISRGRARFWKRQFIAKGMSIFDNATEGAWDDVITTGSQDTSPDGIEFQKTLIDKSTRFTDTTTEVPYPLPMQFIGIHPDDTLAEAGRKVWLFHFALMLSHEQGTLLGEQVEELHDMRVATRRMRTAFDVFGQAFDPKILRHHLKGLRSVGRTLGGVRDMDVILANALGYQNKMKEERQPGLEPLIDAWEQVIHKKRLKMIRHLQSEDYLDFKYHFNIFLQPPGHSNADDGNMVTNSHLRDIVPVLVYERYAAVRAYEPVLPSASITQLHALRIEFKKFRYVLEYFREILGDSAGQAISDLKQVQDHLGELHDSDVACGLVSDFLQGWIKGESSTPITERQNPEPMVTYLAYLHAERYRLVSKFPELWRKFSLPQFRQNIAQSISLL